METDQPTHQAWPFGQCMEAVHPIFKALLLNGNTVDLTFKTLERGTVVILTGIRDMDTVYLKTPLYPEQPIPAYDDHEAWVFFMADKEIVAYAVTIAVGDLNRTQTAEEKLLLLRELHSMSAPDDDEVQTLISRILEDEPYQFSEGSVFSKWFVSQFDSRHPVWNYIRRNL